MVVTTIGSSPSGAETLQLPNANSTGNSSVNVMINDNAFFNVTPQLSDPVHSAYPHASGDDRLQTR